jgi:hypothetical protein
LLALFLLFAYVQFSHQYFDCLFGGAQEGDNSKKIVAFNQSKEGEFFVPGAFEELVTVDMIEKIQNYAKEDVVVICWWEVTTIL